jgi:NitT/TauT family transport system ATP-binding protein
MAAVTVKRVWKEYGNQVVLENLNFTIADHEFVTIVGASGCGKTTFLRMLLGVEKPSRGQLLIDGKPIAAEPGPERGIVFQRYSLFPHLTVLQNLLLGLDGARDKFPAQLSGGMQQRLSIAQSVIREPKVLLLDEPFGALDPGITADMHEIVLRLWAQNRMTIFMITHDLKESFQLGTRVLVFDKPRIDPQSPEAYGATVTYDIALGKKTNRAPVIAHGVVAPQGVSDESHVETHAAGTV